jgi:CRP-like cAMP-binding protein
MSECSDNDHAPSEQGASKGTYYAYPFTREFRSQQYINNNGLYSYINPIYTGSSKKMSDVERELGTAMRLKDFLASIPSFADFSEQQLLLLEQKAYVKRFAEGQCVFRQGDKGDVFYVIHSGSVDILIQDNPALIATGEFGTVVNKLTEGCYFGERALMTSEPRAATVRACEATTCLVFNRQVFEDAISGSNALLGNDINDNVDWSKDPETFSLYRHIEKIKRIEALDTTPKQKQLLYELATAFTPELSADEVIARMVMSVRLALGGDRVGLFVLSEDKMSMMLKVSERSKGIRLPIRGLAGAVLESNKPLNVPNAYLDSRFDSTMDKRTGYVTRQVLGVPVKHPQTSEAIGLLQVNNRVDGSLEPFTAEEQGILELAAEQLADLLYGRVDVLINDPTTPLSNLVKEVAVVKSSDVATPFQVELFSFNCFMSELKTVEPTTICFLEVTVSLHLALNVLCNPRSVIIELPVSGGTSSDEINLTLRNRLIFNISTRDLPRATRILFRVGGSKKRKGPFSAIGWAAAPIFDFKGNMDCQPNVRLFPGDNDVPINTTLSNVHDSRAPSISSVLAADLLFAANITAPRVTIVHSMPEAKLGAIQGSAEDFSPHDIAELQRILLLSFNPLSATLLTQQDKEFLWSLRYNILERPELLAAFLISVQWQIAEHVQQVYELLDLWEPPVAAQALQLLDRRFMDPKVRAFAVHCLEELEDEELALYMLQLCQQLKFENHADSALSRFLLRRALTNQRLIGHIFFWQLQSEVQNVDVRSRFIVLLQV